MLSFAAQRMRPRATAVVVALSLLPGIADAGAFTRHTVPSPARHCPKAPGTEAPPLPRLQALVAQADASSMPMDSRSPGANAPSSWPVDQWISTSSGAALLVLGVTVWIATVRKRRVARKAGEHKLSW